MPDPEDAEVRACIRTCRAETVSAIVAELEAQFGPERAWSADMVSEYIRLTHEARRAWRWSYEDDPAILAFISDRAELVTVSEIARLGAEHFKPARFPSKSAVHRAVSRLRVERRRRAAAKS